MTQIQETLLSLMQADSHNFSKQSLQIKQDDKFFGGAFSKETSLVKSKETSVGNSACSVLYYGGAGGAVPFMWESQPGTPKHTFSDASLPPLTPPPASYSAPKSGSKENSSKPNGRYSIFPKLSQRKSSVSSASSLSSISFSSLSSISFSSWSSTYSSPPSLKKPNYLSRHSSSWTRSPNSRLRFDARGKTSSWFRRCCTMGKVKIGLWSVAGGRTGRGTGQ